MRLFDYHRQYNMHTDSLISTWIYPEHLIMLCRYLAMSPMRSKILLSHCPSGCDNQLCCRGQRTKLVSTARILQLFTMLWIFRHAATLWLGALLFSCWTSAELWAYVMLRPHITTWLLRQQLVKTSTKRNISNQNIGRPKRRQTEMATVQTVDKPKRWQTETSTNRTVDNPKRRRFDYWHFGLSMFWLKNNLHPTITRCA